MKWNVRRTPLTRASPKWAPPNVALAQIVIHRGLLDEAVNLLGHRNLHIRVEVAPTQLGLHPADGFAVAPIGRRPSPGRPLGRLPGIFRSPIPLAAGNGTRCC